MEITWQQYSKRRVPELRSQLEGLTAQEAMKIAGREWREYSEGGGEVGSKRTSRVVIDYISEVAGVLPEEKAADIALGLIDGLLEYADASHAEEYNVMRRRAAELFRGQERTTEDTVERRFGYDLAEYVVLAVIDRELSWSALEPSVLSGGSKGSGKEMPDFGGGMPPPLELTAEQELGLSPKPSVKGRATKTAIDATVKALKEIMES